MPTPQHRLALALHVFQQPAAVKWSCPPASRTQTGGLWVNFYFYLFKFFFFFLVFCCCCLWQHMLICLCYFCCCFIEIVFFCCCCCVWGLYCFCAQVHSPQHATQSMRVFLRMCVCVRVMHLFLLCWYSGVKCLLPELCGQLLLMLRQFNYMCFYERSSCICLALQVF